MNDIDSQSLAALASGRAMLRKLPHWSGALSAGSVSAAGNDLVYAALTPAAGVSDADADEVVFVERSRLPVDSPEFALPSAARWSALRRIERALLVAEPERVTARVDGVAGEAFAWRVGTSRLVVTIHGGLRYEAWAPSDLDVALVPLADADTVELSWLS